MKAGSAPVKRPRATATKKSPGRAPKSSKPVPPRELARHWSVPVVAAAFVALMLGAAYYPVMKVQYREVREKSRLQAELRALRQRNERLRLDVARLKTREGIEDLARSQLGLVRKGEHVAVIVDGDAPEPTATPAPDLENEVPSAAEQPAGTWTAFLDAVFDVGN
ncbi:MAG: septum formation initiator family protein [Coriobacteriales bacterium]|nr:septum formation initiator family protein [Coriobacteriales bacterium]